MNNVYVIAEVAQGYEGSVEICKLFIRGAKAAGADAVKFQLVFADDIATEGYQYYNLFKTLEMTSTQWLEVRTLCRTEGIDFIVDVFGEISFKFAKIIQPDGIKIHSTSFFDTSLMEQVFAEELAIYLSVGGIHYSEIESLISRYRLDKRPKFCLLYGFQSEPTPMELNNLKRIPILSERSGISSVGFMDHSDGGSEYSLSLSAVALGLGVKVFEKHLTIDGALEMEDSISALGISDFKKYTKNLRHLFLAMGSGGLELTENELSYRNKALKRVVASQNLIAGQKITSNCVSMRRPSEMAGLFNISDVVGKKVKRSLEKGKAITLEILSDE